MKLVADTSVLYSFFNEQSEARELASKVRLVSPRFSLSEIQEHKEDIKSSFKLEEWQYEFILRFWVLKFVEFIPESKYIKQFEKSMHLSPDSDDIDFFALSLKLGCPIWSNDPHFKMQSEVRVFTTKELIEFLLL